MAIAVLASLSYKRWYGGLGGGGVFVGSGDTIASKLNLHSGPIMSV